jgi:hypothetical protein
MGIETRALRHGSNGHRCRLARATETGRVIIRHEVDLPSGGRARLASRSLEHLHFTIAGA